MEHPHSKRDNQPDIYSPEVLDRVETIEFLPFSHAFEHVMYDHRVVRSVEHHMNEAITFTPDIFEEKFPPNLRDLFPFSSYTIEELTAVHTESPEDTSTLSISFQANGMRHNVYMSGAETTYTIASHNDDLTYTFNSAVGTSLLATLVYARQRNKYDPDAPIQLTESQLALPRNAEDTLNEQLLMTLGHHDGRSTITTTSLFEVNGDVLAAKLVECEQPDLSSLQNKLELTRLTFVDKMDETKLFQNTVNVLRSPGTLDSHFAEHYTSTEPELIDPVQNYDKWVNICDEFLSAIEDDLNTYAHLDD